MSPMHNPSHPGVILAEYIEPTGLTQGEVAECLGISRQQLGAIINGRADVTPEMAVRLALAFDTSPQLWTNLQTNYDLWLIDKAGHPKVKPIIKHKAA